MNIASTNSKANIKIPLQICRQNGILPTYAKPNDAGMDVYAAEEVFVTPGQTKIVPLGFKVAIPVGYELQIRPRSGVSLKTALRIANAPGTIDSGYREEVGVLVSNMAMMQGDNLSTLEKVDGDKNQFFQNGTIHIKVGDRIAQMVLQQVDTVVWEQVEDVSIIGEDRGGGMGHTGISEPLKTEPIAKTADRKGSSSSNKPAVANP